MSFLSRMSLANRSLVALATIAVLIFGALVIPALKQELYPSLEFPAVTVITSYPGASPLLVEQNVTAPLEQSIQGLQNIQQITSYSNQNSSVIVVEYNFGIDLNQASQQISQQISRIQASLPAGVQAPQVQTFNINALPIIQLAVSANEDQATLAADLKTRVVPVLSGLDGVARVNVTGVRARVVSITLDPTKMQARGVSLQAISGALQANNVTLPAGQVTSSGQTFAISAGSQFARLADIEQLIVGTSLLSPCTQAQAAALGAQSATLCKPRPGPIRLSDVATVRQDLAPSTSLTRTNGEPSLGISITKVADGNTVNVSQAVNSQLDALQRQLGAQARITVISDQAPAVTSAVRGLVNEGLIGAAFAILVILLFLFSLRSTLVTAISIPLSVVIALIALWLGNLSLNLFTLGALTIAVGRVVDDSIVVLENIYRHLGDGEEKRTAIPAAVREVAGAVTASTLTTVAVFLPIAFTGGLVGQVFGPFAVTVTVALAASLFVALTIIPVLAYWFLQTSRLSQGAGKRAAAQEKRTLLERGYVPLVRWVTGHKAIFLSVAFVLFSGSLVLTPLLGTNFFSSAQQNTYTITQTLPVGTSLEVTDRDAQQVENVLSDLAPTIEHYQVTIGSAGTFAQISGAAGGANSASFSLTTDPAADQAAFQSDLQRRLNALGDVGTLKFSASSGGFNSSGLAVNIQAPDQATLARATQQVLSVFAGVSDLTNISSNLTVAAPLYDVQVDPLRAAAHGLSAQQVGLLLRDVYTGTTVTTVNFDGVQQEVNLQLGTPAGTLADLENLQLPAQVGQQTIWVKLADVATVTRTLGPTQITHLGGQRTATVSANATTNNVGSVSREIQRQIDALQLPAGVTIAAGGVAQSQAQAFSSLEIALLAAIILVYLVMVAAFRSLVQPLILLVSIPFAATGSLLLMLATHTELGVPSLIGLLMLVGIVVTNAIVLLDLVRQYRARGMDARTAVIEGGRRRLRPILMTAVATILALLPMALGLSKDSGFIAAPLAITVIGGLTSSTVLTLLLVPTLYVLAEGRKGRRPAAPADELWPAGRGQEAGTQPVAQST
ncbi:MAG TPA: efflux RND transporter permease subunit [Ktedonobacteraceae bacterium]|jgi:HAE1 family hydrophobic/amphiphilic exporter-1